MPSKYNYVEPNFVQEFLRADQERKLSTEQRAAITRNRAAVQLSPEEFLTDIRTELSATNSKELDSAIAAASDPAIAQILINERRGIEKLKTQVTAHEAAQAARKQTEESSFIESLFQQAGELIQSILPFGRKP